MRGGQSKTQSMAEALINAATGYGIAIGSQELLFPFFGIPNLPTSSHIKLALCFTIISIFRSFILRRLFNWYYIYVGNKKSLEVTPTETLLRKT